MAVIRDGLMCIICKDWELGKLTSKEAFKNLGEMMEAAKNDAEESKHLFEVYEKILDKEVPISDNDEELNKNWHDENHGGD